MISTPDTQFIGSFSQGAISNASAVMLGKKASKLVIDLTKASLHKRLTYTGPAHYYWSEDGTLTLSAANEWPLEYDDGVATGRHEPEKASTNLQAYSRADALVSGIIVADGASFSASTGPDGSGIGSIDPADTYYAVYNSTTSAWIQSQVSGYGPANWTRYSTKFTGAAAIQTYLGGQSTSNYMYAAASGMTESATYVTSHFRKLVDTVLLTGLVQVEAGSVTTSPIINEGSGIATRSASSVVLDTSGFTTVTLTYTDGTTVTATPEDDSYTLPLASLNWGDRVLTKITLEA